MTREDSRPSLLNETRRWGLNALGVKELQAAKIFEIPLADLDPIVVRTLALGTCLFLRQGPNPAA